VAKTSGNIAFSYNPRYGLDRDRSKKTWATSWVTRQVELELPRFCMPLSEYGIYRASLRGDSTYVLAQAEVVAAELLNGNRRTEAGKIKLVETRKAVEGGWHSIASLLAKDGHRDLANDVRQFVERMPAPKTEREGLAAQLLERAREQRTRRQEHVRQR
jgi:hypothetical protein